MEIKRNYKDSVFNHLFSKSQYRLELFKTIFPDEKNVKEEDLIPLDSESIVFNGLVNDISFQYKNRVIILIEEQTQFSANIALRMLFYSVKHLQDYISKNRINLHRMAEVDLPDVNLFCICLDKRPVEFVEFKNKSIDINVKMIYKDEQSTDIINQYLEFAQIGDAYLNAFGKTEATMNQIIDTCIDKHILKEYLSEEREEVIRAMSLFISQEEVTLAYGHEMKEEGRTEGRAEGLIKGRAEGILEAGARIYLKNYPLEEAVQLFSEEFNISKEETRKYFEQYDKEK